ncbi:MAG: ATP-binding protein, partial [Planctomycetota bacterium]
ERVVVEVADTGTGIPPDLRETIFRPFFTTKERGEGTGLGLPTARRIIELHGGSLALAESSAAGTVFRVRLRARREAEQLV